MPTSAVNADLYLLGKCPLGYLAIDGRLGEACAMQDGVEADDAVWLGHGLASTRRLILAP